MPRRETERREHRFTRELATAEEALRAGDLHHAAFHAAGALALAPDDARAQALVDQILDEPPGLWQRLKRPFSRWRPGDWLPESDWFGYVAARARADWRAGNLDVAFSTMVQVALTAPDVDYSSWILAIAKEALAQRQPLDARWYFQAFGSEFSARYIGLLHLRPSERAFNAPWAELGLVLREVLAQAADPTQPTLAMCLSAFLRRAGRAKDALAVASAVQCTDDRRPLLLAQIGLGARAMGAFDQAVAAFQEAHRLTQDRDYLFEAARVRFDQRCFAEALEHFERAATTGPVDDEVDLAMDVCRLQLGGTVAHSARITVPFPGEAPDYDQIRRWFLGDGSGLRMDDASVNGLHQVLAEQPDLRPPMSFKLTLTALESPSVLVTLSLVTGLALDALNYHYEATPTPHPFSPLDPAGFDPWQAAGVAGRLCTRKISAPSDRVAELVSAVATPWSSMAELWRRARALEHDDVEPRDLLAAMVHPPPLPPGSHPDEHVFCWQIAAAILLATVREGQPWYGSARREGLRALLLGPPDWTTAAGLLAMTEVLLDHPEALEDAREWLDLLVANAPDQGHCCWAVPLAHLAIHVPGLRRDLLAPLKTWLEPAEDGDLIPAEPAGLVVLP